MNLKIFHSRIVRLHAVVEDCVNIFFLIFITSLSQSLVDAIAIPMKTDVCVKIYKMY